MNFCAIKLIDDFQLSYKPLNCLKLVDFKILNTYIETNLISISISLSKLLIYLFLNKLNKKFGLNMENYLLYNLNIKINIYCYILVGL